MLRTIANYAYVFPILAIVFLALWMLGGEDIVFFRRKKYLEDPKSIENLYRALESFARSRGFKVLGPLTLEFGGETRYYDALLVSFYGTIAIKAAPQNGEIYTDGTDGSWLQIYEKCRKRFDDPTVSLKGTGKFFRDLYRAENVKFGKTDSMVVFTGKNTIVATSKVMPVVQLFNLSEKLEKEYLADNGADIDAMRLALEKYTV